MRPLLLSVTLTALAQAEDVIRPGDRYAVIEGETVRGLVPAEQAAALRPLVARADAILRAMARDAGVGSGARLPLQFADHFDDHNGFSITVPYAMVQVQLASDPPTSFIFTGHDELERTLVHEFAHHLSNHDDPQPVRRALRSVFGNVLPSEPFSALLFYVSTPAHVTMPDFWHEGLAQWAETTYADPRSAWTGRGRDSLTHLVWRLDAADDAIPPPGDWRQSRQRWPFGSSAYLYGLAYTRHLASACTDRGDLWAFMRAQQASWAFEFDRGARAVAGVAHATLIAEARAALLTEQRDQLQRLRAAPVTSAKRLTPPDTSLGAPAWLPSGELFLAVDQPTGRPRYMRCNRDGELTDLGMAAWAMAPARSSGYQLAFAEQPVGNDQFARSRVVVLRIERGQHAFMGSFGPNPNLENQLFALGAPRFENLVFDEERLTMPDAVAKQLAAIAIRPAHAQMLVVKHIDLETWTEFSTQGRPWSPALRPRANALPERETLVKYPTLPPAPTDLCWVETDHDGSRLVLAPLADPAQRTVLAQVRGRILHPCWTADGARVFFCADHSGVANAYAVDVAHPQQLIPVTNTIGGVVACVPSPDGTDLAIIDHDRQGPFLAIISADPKTWATAVPHIELAWPAPVAPRSGALPEQPAARPLPVDPGTAAEPVPYRGWAEIRPWFWTPTTLVVPEGGYGVVAVGGDPLATHQLQLSAGVGAADGTPIGLAAWSYGGWPVDLTALGWRAELAYDNEMVRSDGSAADWIDQRDTVELRAGLHRDGQRRSWRAWLAGGVTDPSPADATRDELANGAIPLVTPESGSERYAEAVLAYDDGTLFPGSYAREDGGTLALSVRRSGFGGDIDGTSARADAGWTLSVVPAWGHQVVVGGSAGWSDTPATLQGRFDVGGNLGQGLPRGYNLIQASGAHLLGGSAAYRLPLWRPYHGADTSPWAWRQLVLEGFYDAARAGDDDFGRDSDWYRSVGAELHLDFTFSDIPLAPGLGIARQLDGDEDVTAWLALGFRF